MQEKITIVKKIYQNPINLQQLIAKLFLLSFVVLYAALPTFASAQTAGTGQFALSPASGSYQVGSTLRVTISSTSSDAIIGVQAILNYDASKLQYLNADTSASAFTLFCASAGSNGIVEVGCAHGSSLTGTRTVGSVNFKVLGGSGTTAITFASASSLSSAVGAIVRASDSQNIWSGSTTGGTYTLTTPAAPPAAPPTTGTGSSGSGTGSTGTTKPTPPATGTTPTTPGSPTGATEQTPDAKVPNRYFVAVTLLDKEGNFIANKEVTLADQTVKTDSLGVASFTNVPAGNHEVTDGSGKVLATINVEDNPSKLTDVQKFDAQVKPDNKWKGYILPAVGFIGLLVALFVSVKLLKKRHLNKLNQKRHFPSQPSNPVPPATSGIVAPSSTTQTTQPPQSVNPTGETIQPSSGETGDTKKPVVWPGDDK